MFSVTCIHKFINTICILCLKMLIQMSQMILPLSGFFDCVKFCDSRQIVNSTQLYLSLERLVLMSRLAARLVFKKWAMAWKCSAPPGPGGFSSHSRPHAPWPRVTGGCLIHCVCGELRTILVYPALVPHTWLGPHQLWGVFVVWWGGFAPASLIHDPFLYSAVDTNPPLRCTTWNGNVRGSNQEYICTKNIDTLAICTLPLD